MVGTAGAARGLARGREGEKVQVVLDHIRGDKRHQAESFYDLFWHNPDAWPAEYQEARTTTRLLYPTEANDDGTYTYAWLFDPVVEGADYDILKVLKKMYGDQKAEEYFRSWADAHASEQVAYSFEQT